MAEATIRDVATRAELSVATVSRALNGMENVSEQARQRIAAAVQELGYVPHAGARSLSLARTNAIGVVLPDLHGEFFSEFVRGMDREANNRGYLLLLSNFHGGHEQAAKVLRAMRGRVDGLIVMAPHLATRDLSQSLSKGVPTILVNSREGSEHHPAIRLDNKAGVDRIVEHFAALGRRHLVHVAGPRDNFDAQERAEAFRRAVDAHGLEGELIEGDFEIRSGEEAINALIATGRPFDAIFAANDNMAIGALNAIRASGRKVPEDVAVAGFDDIPLARHLGITTVRVRIAELGERAVSRLLDSLSGSDDAEDEMHRPELIVRRTTQAG